MRQITHNTLTDDTAPSSGGVFAGVLSFALALITVLNVGVAAASAEGADAAKSVKPVPVASIAAAPTAEVEGAVRQDEVLAAASAIFFALAPCDQRQLIAQPRVSEPRGVLPVVPSAARSERAVLMAQSLALDQQLTL